MTVRLLAGRGCVWDDITRYARQSTRADVAVAYFGKGGARQLPLARGSRLVVNASLANVKAGATCPAELITLVRRGVKVFSYEGLHAKVYVFPRRACVGSANISAASAGALTEAVIMTTEAACIRRAREFVGELCVGVPMGIEELKKLQKAYRPPRASGGRVQKRSNSTTPRVWFEVFEGEDPPEGSDDFIEELMGEAKSKRQHRSGFKLEETWRSGRPKYRDGDILVPVEREGRRELVRPPGRVIHVREWSNGRSRTTFSVIEYRDLRRIDRKKMARSIGPSWRKRPKDGCLNAKLAVPLLNWWNERA